MILHERVRSAVARVPAVFRTVLGNADLRRLELAFVAFNAAEWATWIAILVYAYERGGTTEAGLLAVVMLVPAALVAPVASALGDRHRPGTVLFWGYVAQAVAMGATAVLLIVDGPPLAAYALATIASVSVTVTRPTMSAFTPTLARTTEELTGVNVVSSWIESASVLVAPALAGVILAVSGAGAVFAVMAVGLAVGAVLVRPVPGPPPAGTGEAAEPVLPSLFASARVLRDERPARLLVILLTADFVALGALDVLYPELAIGVLDRSSSWAGYLNAAFGAGATFAIALTASLVGRPRLMPAMLLGLGVYVTAFVLLAAYPTAGTALVLLAAGGAGRVVLDVGARTLLQRVAPSDTLARVFGLLEGIAMAGLAVGSLVVVALVALGGPSLAIVGIGLILPLAALVGGRSLLDVDRQATVPVVEIGLLRSLPLFSPLQPVQMEAVARALERIDVPAGTEVISEGETGDHFYVIADGSVEVLRGGVRVAVLGRGDGFGEVALLHAVPRTATCRTTGPATLYALDQEEFFVALTGHPRVDTEARRLAAERRPEAGATTTVR